MRNAAGVYGLLLLLIALAVASRVLRRPIRLFCGWTLPERTVPVSRGRIFLISLGYSLIELLLLDLALMGLFVAKWLAGEMTPSSLALACVLVSAMLGAIAFALRHIVLRPPYAFYARRGVDFNALRAGARMKKASDDTWVYADDNWYIAARPGVACVLYAPLIDFSKPFPVELRISAPRYGYSHYLFRCAAKDGTELVSNYAKADGALNIWLRRFGGRLS